VIVARNLEPIYDIATALRAFALILQDAPHAKLTVAGSGPEHRALTSLVGELGISEAVTFSGRLDRGRMAELYRSASVMINPSRIDNMPNSVLEAMASGVPVVSTDVGGIPFIVRDGITGLLCRAGDHAAIAAAVQRILRDQPLAARLRDAALIEVQQYTWSRVRQTWVDLYASVLSRGRIEVRPA
jgi:glycosyltransferase involved in cell wall biosynthesis